MDDGKAQQIVTTYRMRVLAVVEQSPHALTGREIAAAACMSYKQTIDALNALYNYGKVQRHGRKFMARWSRVLPLPPVPQLHPLDLLMFRLVKNRKRN